ETILVRPDPALLFGSAANAVAVSADGRTLYVANGGNNAVAVVELAAAKGAKSRVAGFIPTAWYPGAVAVDGDELFVADVKGFGSRAPAKVWKPGRDVHDFLGAVSKVRRPGPGELARYTAQVREAA